jgi:hypothetical protein
MTVAAQKRVKDALKSIEDAQRYLASLAKGADIPMTPEDLAKAVETFRAALTENQAAANALVLAVLGDEPCPVSLFKPWASYAQIRLWSKRETDRLETEVLNGKLCVKPTAFFATLKKLGKAKEGQE